MPCLHGCGVLTEVTGRLNGEGYIDILGDALLPSAHLLGYGDHFFLQDDNAPCHRARIVQEWKADQGFQTLQWPAQCPDLYPIENFCPDMKRENRRHPQNTLRDLHTELHNMWSRISHQRCTQLIWSMPTRIQECIRACDGHTHY